MNSPPDLSQPADVAREMAVEWGVKLGPPFERSKYSYVALAGEDAVLKVAPPDDDESNEQAEALELWDGVGAVRLLRRDRDRRALLLERARPGTDISGLPEAEATRIAVDVASRLWRPAGEPFRWIGDFVGGWLDAARGSDPEQPLLALAGDIYASLEVARETLVHGDFHHHNILASERGFLAIDPKPMLGEPEFDVLPFLWNPEFTRMQVDVAERRLAAFAAAGLDNYRMRAWSVIRGAYLGADENDVEVLLELFAAVER